MNSKIFLTFAVIVLSVSGCSQRDREREADLASLKEFISNAGDAVNAGDVEREVEKFTEDGIYMWPNAPAIEGRDELRNWFEMRFSKFDVELESESLELVLADGWAYERGRSVARIRPKSGGEVMVVKGKYLNIFRKEPNGEWKIARRIRNSDHPLGQ